MGFQPMDVCPRHSSVLDRKSTRRSRSSSLSKSGCAAGFFASAKGMRTGLMGWKPMPQNSRLARWDGYAFPTMADPLSELTDTPTERYNRKLGLWLFLLYLSLYVAFVGIITVDYRIMATEVVAGLNLAIVYGFGLIFAAFVLAVIYMVACKKEAADGR